MRLNAERFKETIRQLDTYSSGSGFVLGHTLPSQIEMDLHEWCHVYASFKRVRTNEPLGVSSKVSKIVGRMGYADSRVNEAVTLAIQMIIMSAAGWFMPPNGHRNWLSSIADDQKNWDLMKKVPELAKDPAIRDLARKTVRCMQYRAYRQRRRTHGNSVQHTTTGQDQEGDNGRVP